MAVDARPLREHVSLTNFYKHLQVGALPLTLIPLLALYGVCTTKTDSRTLWVTAIYYLFTTMAITAGYHRAFAHKAYEASSALKFVLLMFGAGAMQGSGKWWIRGHRAHHRYSDTPQDPYGVHEGFWHAHLGWMFFTPRFKPGYVDMSDIDKDKLIQWQHKNFVSLMLFFGVAAPLLVCGLGWGDWRGGFYYACMLRLTCSHHATFSINSVAHYLGEATYDDLRSPRDNLLTAIITNGEGYHNFHHEFPYDYRNAIRWYQYDPTKAFIWVCSLFKLATRLRRCEDDHIERSRLQMQQKRLDERKARIPWPKAGEELPELTASDVAERVRADSAKLIICDGFVHDVTDFMADHPGGRALISTRLGRDITEDFHGKVYKHSNAGNNALQMLRVAKIKDESVCSIAKTSAFEPHSTTVALSNSEDDSQSDDAASDASSARTPENAMTILKDAGVEVNVVELLEL
ncbi:stearoyl-CoA 9-desaturase [Savitreella phatthalungensis]